jgi:hypothetical protein
MTRRTRRPTPYVAAHPRDILHLPRLEGQNVDIATDPEPAPSNGLPTPFIRPAGSSPELAPAPSGSGTSSSPADRRRVPGTAAPLREKTLHELNLEARAIDREHARLRAEAAERAKEVVEPMLAGVPRGRAVVRRMQKNLRPPVRHQ